MTWKFNKDRLIALREMLGLTQEKFAERIGTVKQHISLWETGVTIPSVRTLVKICNIFDVAPRYFFTSDEHNNDAHSKIPDEEVSYS